MSDSAMSLSTPECSRPFSLSPVHNWPNCLTHSADLTTQAYLRGAAQATQDTHSYLLYNVTAKSDLTQVDRQTDGQTVPRSVGTLRYTRAGYTYIPVSLGPYSVKTRGSRTRWSCKFTSVQDRWRSPGHNVIPKLPSPYLYTPTYLLAGQHSRRDMRTPGICILFSLFSSSPSAIPSARCSLRSRSPFPTRGAIFNGFAQSLSRSSLRCLRKTYGFSRITAATRGAAAASDYARGSVAHLLLPTLARLCP